QSIAPVKKLDFENAKQILEMKCTSCHQISEGDVPILGEKLNLKPISLDSRILRGIRTPLAVYSVLVGGISHSEMGSYKELLTVDSIWDLSFYIMTLNYTLPMTSDCKMQVDLRDLTRLTDNQLNDLFSDGNDRCQLPSQHLRLVAPLRDELTKFDDNESMGILSKRSYRGLILLVFAIISVSALFVFALRKRART
ncbi:MAG: cytochrome c, partial [Proteobacteria bacterium]|nr:cytochrome c [Pseudomonadota bacterium]